MTLLCPNAQTNKVGEIDRLKGKFQVIRQKCASPLSLETTGYQL